MLFQREFVPRPSEKMRIDMHLCYAEQGLLAGAKGTVILTLLSPDGDVLSHQTLENRITRDAGILAARLFRNSLSPNTNQNNGLTMLAVGTGATGNLLSPDAPQDTQRKLNTEISRKAFSSVQFRNTDGLAVSIPTNIVDFTATFGGSEAVGPLNEMGLLSTYSLNPLTKNPINNGPSNYDATIDVTGKDILANYLTFSVITKPNGSVLSITWRFTF